MANEMDARKPKKILLILSVVVGILLIGEILFDGFSKITDSVLKTPQSAPQLSQEERDAQLKNALRGFLFTETPSLSPEQKAMAQFGRELFFDQRFSSNGAVACASCHVPDLNFTDAKPVATALAAGTKNTPTIINTFANSWFMWDGRADSLASQALKPLEDGSEHGISRGRVAQLLFQHYRPRYEAFFGPFPRNLVKLLEKTGEKEFHALPGPIELKMPVALSAYAVATLDSFSIQRRLITQAYGDDESPQGRLARLAMQQLPQNPEWVARYNQLTAAEQKELNEVFSRFGLAVAAFEKGLVAMESPFDRFAREIASGKPLAESFNPQFGEAEWQGFQTFVDKGCTNCHNGPNFTDQQFHNIGLAQKGEELELGRARGAILVGKDIFNCLNNVLPTSEQESCLELPFLSLENLEYVGAQKTPTLRNVEHTSPYMHDGRFKTLDQVLEHYNKLEAKAAVGHREESLQPMNLEAEELEKLKAFLRSISSSVRDLSQEKTSS